jgi:hypothetical protein
MKQPIDGLKGIKPRPPKVEGNGEIEKEESRELDKEYRVHRNEILRIKKESEQAKLKRLNGDLLDRRQAEFLFNNALATLRTEILRLPTLICADLRELNYNKVFEIRRRIETTLDTFLSELATNLEKAADPRGVAALDEEEGGNGQDLSAEAVQAKKDALARKKIAANETRRAKRKSKQAHGQY